LSRSSGEKKKGHFKEIGNHR